MALNDHMTKVNSDAATDDPKQWRSEIAGNTDTYNAMVDLLKTIATLNIGDGLKDDGLGNLDLDLGTNPGLVITGGQVLVKPGPGTKLTASGVEADINGLTEDTSPDGANDFLMTYDDSAGVLKKALPSNLPAGSPASQAEARAGTNNTKSMTPLRTVDAVGMWLLDQQTASASSEIDLITGISSTYDSYIIKLINVIPSGAVGLQMLISTDTGSTFKTGASDYAWGVHRTDAHTTTTDETAEGDESDSEIQLSGTISQGTTFGFSGNIELWGPSNASVNTEISWNGIFRNSNARFTRVSGIGVYLANTVVDAIRFKFASGTITSGKFKLYGVRAI